MVHSATKMIFQNISVFNSKIIQKKYSRTKEQQQRKNYITFFEKKKTITLNEINKTQFHALFLISTKESKYLITIEIDIVKNGNKKYNKNKRKWEKKNRLKKNV